MAEAGLNPSPLTLLTSNVAPWRGLPQGPSLACPLRATLLYSGSRPTTGSDHSPPFKHLFLALSLGNEIAQVTECPAPRHSALTPSRACAPGPLLSPSTERSSCGEPSPHPRRGACRDTPSRPTWMARAGPARQPRSLRGRSHPRHPCNPAAWLRTGRSAATRHGVR